MATELEEAEFAELTTTEGARNTTLRLTLPRRGGPLVIVAKNSAYCNLYLNQGQFDLHAPRAKARLDVEVVKGNWGQRYWENIDPFLEILPEAYREANGAT